MNRKDKDIINLVNKKVIIFTILKQKALYTFCT